MINPVSDRNINILLTFCKTCLIIFFFILQYGRYITGNIVQEKNTKNQVCSLFTSFSLLFCWKYYGVLAQIIAKLARAKALFFSPSVFHTSLVKWFSTREDESGDATEEVKEKRGEGEEERELCRKFALPLYSHLQCGKKRNTRGKRVQSPLLPFLWR